MKTYWVSFGSQDPRTYTALGASVSFIQFFNQNGQTLAAPGISEMFTGSGAYAFQYSVGFSQSIWGLIDGGATLNASVRYVRVQLDPVDTLDLVVGYTASNFGNTGGVAPDVLGYLKRINEWLSGTQTFNNTTGAWSVYDRSASTLLGLKTLTNSVSGVTAIP